MKNLLLSIIVLIAVIIILFLLPIFQFSFKAANDTYKTVYISKFDNRFVLVRNGNPYVIKGAGGNMNLEYLAAIGGNTIRLYDTIDVAGLLDEAHKHELAVIIDIPLPRARKDYYASETANRLIKEKVRALVRKNKDHPALLMWNLGNELYYPFALRKNNFIRTFNDLIDIIHEEDPNHPVSTAMAGVGRKSALSIFIHSPKLDLLGFNIFGDTPNLHSKVNQLFFFGRRPYYISEFGSDGPWETELTSWNAPIEPSSSKKARQIIDRYSVFNENKDGGCLGTLAFYWGNKMERTYTWFSYFVDDYKLECIAELEALWKNTGVPAERFKIQGMVIDGRQATGNLVFAPNNLKLAEIYFDKKSEHLPVKWEIYEEAWPWAWSSRQDSSFTLFDPKKKVNTFIGFSGNSAEFITPEKEGPYRIFAFIYDQEGYFATANVPFYILARK
jgi:hypothetical protein